MWQLQKEWLSETLYRTAVQFKNKIYALKNKFMAPYNPERAKRSSYYTTWNLNADASCFKLKNENGLEGCGYGAHQCQVAFSSTLIPIASLVFHNYWLLHHS